ncbi:OmpP1/FadL family transporter [Fodinibius salsisoli]|uniref:Outer membrane protein transport protein n=1 Tax=Fodinibius salsisoli TaxID=2820877 RepID=A0ABT3PR70_9BACT|nr:outer membrane protein transport protein [Fodinibius salsisoli]MCW9708363.1 outer membrane protein transport protein [Fodinibius salsisoli]
MNIRSISKKWAFLCIPLFLTIGILSTAQAQNATDVLRYSLEYPSYDPVTLVMPGIGSHTGYGAYQDNPASMAFAENGYMSFSLSSRYVDESATYLGNVSDFSDTQTSVGDLGFLYKFPTKRGSLVIGGGYSQSTDYNRAFSVNARNNESTLTDFYNSSFITDDLYFAAYDAFAIYDPTPGDDSYENTTSVFRAGRNYEGINQNMEVVERGQLGNYSAFIATEAMKNLYLGASIGFSSGTYTYERDFLESDPDNIYNNSANNTDIDDILSLDTIEATIQAFSAQLGLVYQPTEQFNIGVSYEFPSRLQVDETFNTEIITTFDNGDVAETEAPADFSYEVIRPQRLKGGLTYSNEGLTISALAEGVFYSQAEYDEEGISDYETDLNNTIESNFKDVVNFRGGLEYEMNNKFTPRVGYGYMPSPTRGFDSSRQFVSGGFSTEINQSMIFNLGLQYSFWDDESSLYDYEAPDGNIFAERATEEVGHLNVMAGIKIAL